jgi:hypothetical protein
MAKFGAALPGDESVLWDGVTFSGSLLWGKVIDRLSRKVLGGCGSGLFKSFQRFRNLSKL